MSSISAGTSAGTALVQTGDTSGTLQLQVNGTTPAVTLATTGAIGVGSSPSYGTSGQVLTSAGTGAAPTWGTISASAQAITYTNQSSNITLVAANANSLITLTLANDISITLPDATTLTGGRNFTFKNNSATFGITIYNSAGTYVMAIPPLTSNTIWTTSIATAAGAWVSEYPPLPYVGTLNAGNYLYAPSSNPITTQFSSAISSTQAVTLYQANYALYAVVVTNTAGTITYGTPKLITQNSGASGAQAIAMLTATTGIVTWYNFYGTTNSGCVITVSGTTITTGEVTNFTLPTYYADGGMAMAALNSTDAAVVMSMSNGIYCCYLSVSGTTLTATMSGQLFSSFSYPAVAALTSTKLVVTYSDNSTPYCYAVIISISGTSFSSGSTVAMQSTGSLFWHGVTALSSTSFAVAYTDGTNNIIYTKACTVSGTVITAGTSSNTYASNSPRYCSIAALSSTTALVTWNGQSGSTYIFGRVATISGTTISYGTAASTINANTTTTTYYMGTIALQAPNVASPSATDTLLAYCPPNGTVQQIASVSGSTITPYTSNAPVVFENLPNQNVNNKIVALSSTQVATSHQTLKSDGTSYQWTVGLSNISGSTFTEVGTVNVIVSSQRLQLFAISSTLLGVFYQKTNNQIFMNTISISGSTLTLNTEVAIDTSSTSNAGMMACVFSSTLILAVNSRSGVLAFRTVSLSGTTLTANTTTTYSTGYTPSSSLLCYPVSSSRAAVFAVGSGNSNNYVINISGTTPTLSPASSIITGSLLNFAPIGDSKGILVLGSSSTVGSINIMVMDYSEGSPNFAVVNQPNITFPGITLHPTVVALTATTGFILSYTSFNYLLIARYTINGSSVMLTEVQSNESKFNPYAQTYGTYATALQAPLAAGATPNANSLALYNMFSAYPSPSNANAYSDFSICYDQGAVN